MDGFVYYKHSFFLHKMLTDRLLINTFPAFF